MKNFIKKLIAYDKTYNFIKESFVYQLYKKYRAKLANSLYNNPSADFFIIGITGTNGKTTTVNILHKILNDNIAPTLAISTALIKIGGETLENNKKMTSLDNFDLQQLLSTGRVNNCKLAVLEASSQGLDQARFEGIKFDFAVLTNITMDHLDYHGDMEHYAEAKKKLFTYVMKNGKDIKYASMNIDDKYGFKWFQEMAFDHKASFSLINSSIIKATKIEESLEGTYFELSYLGQKYSGVTQLIGSYNVLNILAAISVCAEIGLDLNVALKSIEGFEGVPGRMEGIYTADQIKYFVDFAHTPDGLEKTLSFAAGHKKEGRLITVCGAPGNRDKEKRPLMGDIALKYSDFVIFTDDDPDTENRLKILNDMTANLKTSGIPADKEVFIIPERNYALQLAIEIAKPGDIVILAGKGHENIQITNFGKRPRNDKKNLTELLILSGKQLLNTPAVKLHYLSELKSQYSSQHLNSATFLSQGQN
ncbi:UDP-N-acetylmuramoyl-L-alanyl-D-glutamate--2,6-diaminopimelate ligase [candidate division SR1 bacterium]|nr:UDP-N-acetylmuramoyl-L-alanyl-D-glutamate--2,6-diaminopimelate ligase [candidate division SR1 bacterium]